MSNGIKKEVDVLRNALKDDAGYYYGWQANIAMAFVDEWQRQANNGGLPATPEAIHAIANQASRNFLNLLIKG